MRFQAPRGTQDVLPDQSPKWQRLEAAFRELCRLYGYREIRTPTFEDTELFVRSSGETSEVVSKQMYSFTDKGGRNITLKPEGTAPTIRAMIEHGLCRPGVVERVYYVTPIFRYERPQMGRLREPHQVGIELVGSSAPAADAEVIEFTVRFYERIGLKDVSVLLNSLGRGECRERYRAALLEYAKPALEGMPDDFRASAMRNPLRLLDSKDEGLQKALAGAPKVLDFLEEESREKFGRLQEILRAAKVSFEIDPGIVRGLDYYTETVFEVRSKSLGAQDALCGGGRYDDLIRELGGPDMPSVGVAMGIERALLVLDASGAVAAADAIDVFLAAIGPEAEANARALAATLRDSGISCVTDPDAKSLRSQLNQANRIGARFAAILGEDEIASGTVCLRDMASGEQRSLPASQLGSEIAAQSTDSKARPSPKKASAGVERQ